MYFIGYYIGNQQGHKDGVVKGFDDGVKVALHEVDRYMRGGLTSSLDWETAQRLLREKMCKN